MIAWILRSVALFVVGRLVASWLGGDRRPKRARRGGDGYAEPA